MAALAHKGTAAFQRYAAAIATQERLRARLTRRQLASSAAAAKSSSAESTSTSTTTTTLTRGPHSHVHEVNRSKFVATTFGSVRSAAEALELIRDASARDASHNCFAFVIKKGLCERCSDDGEPAGTAGRPILSAISGEELENVAVLVSRWRSGPKLGPGGLSRAYGAAARDCLRAAVERGFLITLEESCAVRVVVPVDAVGGAYSALMMATSSDSGGSASGEAGSIQEEYGSGGVSDDGGSNRSSSPPLASGLVRLTATVPRSAVAAISAAVAWASCSKGTVSVVEEGEGGDEEGG